MSFKDTLVRIKVQAALGGWERHGTQEQWDHGWYTSWPFPKEWLQFIEVSLSGYMVTGWYEPWMIQKSKVTRQSPSWVTGQSRNPVARIEAQCQRHAPGSSASNLHFNTPEFPTEARSGLVSDYWGCRQGPRTSRQGSKHKNPVFTEPSPRFLFHDDTALRS